MLVFVTGATGFIGRAVVQDLQSHGHDILALARSEQSATTLQNAGIEVLHGDLENHEILKEGARRADAVIHLAFILDLADFPRGALADAAAINAMGSVMEGTGKPFVNASGTLMARGDPATEDTDNIREPPYGLRAVGADAIVNWSQKGVRGTNIRFSPTVHDVDDKGFITMFIEITRKLGFAAYVNDGTTRWPAVHRRDAATLIRLALKKGRAGATYNAVGEQGIPFKHIATAVGAKIGLPVKGIGMEEATEKMGFFAHVASIDNFTSSEGTKKELGWVPGGIGLLEDIQRHYG